MLLKIIDRYRNLQTRTWLFQHYGFVHAIPPTSEPIPGPRFTLAALHETHGRNLTITVADATGQPIADVKVILHWPDAPELPRAGWLRRGVVARTNSAGQAVHILGDGARYTPPVTGPHCLWIGGDQASPMIVGLGMVDGFHLAPVFRLLGEGETIRPVPDPVADALDFLAGAAKHMNSAIDDVAAAVERLQCIPQGPEHVLH